MPQNVEKGTAGRSTALVDDNTAPYSEVERINPTQAGQEKQVMPLENYGYGGAASQPFLNQTHPPGTKCRKGRTGSPNYNDADIDTLLDITEEVEPLGANQWSIVSHKFNEWCQRNGRPVRDAESLKMKFDKLVNVKKPTGDPSCPLPVRRAKHIARSILAKCNAVSVGDGSSQDNEAIRGRNLDAALHQNDEAQKSIEGIDSGSCDTGHKRKGSQIGSRVNKKRAGGTGIRSTSTVDPMIEHVGSISESVQQISDAIVARSSRQGQTFGQDALNEVKQIVKEEIKVELEKTNEALNDLKSVILQYFPSKKRDSETG